MYKYKGKTIIRLLQLESPAAYADISGSDKYPDIHGRVLFFSFDGGTLVMAEVKNLPVGKAPCGQNFFAFHIHEGAGCTGNAQDSFADTGGHLNPDNCEHPAHMGDLMPLLASKSGEAWMMFYTDKFTPGDVKGRTIVVHRGYDDFRTQPSGDAGEKIACGEIF